MFIDDLQWADLSSLNLIQTLLTGHEAHYLLIIGAYRNNEVGPAHPLTSTLKTLENKTTISEIEIGNLDESCVSHLVSDTLHCTMLEAKPLAEVIMDRTQGNAFFVRQFFETIYEQGFLKFKVPGVDDDNRKLWSWDIEGIRNIRGEMGIPPGREVSVLLRNGSDRKLVFIDDMQQVYMYADAVINHNGGIGDNIQSRGRP